MLVCKACEQPLTLQLEEDTGEEQQVPDDLTLPCNCHFHWQCLMDEASSVAVSLKCPACETYLPQNVAGPSVTNTVYTTPQQGSPITARYESEGGVQEAFDILPALTEEAYLLSQPEARPARAFLTMCAEGDVVGIVGVVHAAMDDEEMDDGEPQLSPEALVRYQDPLNQMKSGLHIATEKGQQEVFWLLLFLASRLPTEAFPREVLQSAEQAGLQRFEHGTAEQDIRELRDENGETAEVYASRVGGGWAEVIQGGIFTRSA